MPSHCQPRTLPRALLLALVLLQLAACDRTIHPDQLGRPAPDFTVTDGTQTVHLADYRGRVIVLNFWATWCPPCRQELPSLVALAQHHPELTVLAVSADDDADAYTRFLAIHPMPGIVTIRDAAQRSNDLYGTTEFPETFFIDRTGIVRRKFIGAQDWTSPELADYLSHM